MPDNAASDPECDAAYELFEAYESSQDVILLNKAVSTLQDIIARTPGPHCVQPTRLARLGIMLFNRFKDIDDILDIDESISLLRTAADLTADGQPDHTRWLTILGSALQLRFDRLGELDDLEGATSAVRLAVEQTPDGHIDRPECLANLGNTLQTRFEALGELGDLEGAISAGRLAVELTQDGHSDKPVRLSNLGIALQNRFERLGRRDDLEHSISLQRSAVALTPDNHPDKPIRLNNLSIALQVRFECSGNLADIEHAISIQRLAVEQTEDDDPSKPARLNNLGIALEARSERLGDIDDLDSAISNHRLSVSLTSEDDPDRPALLNSLANAMQSRFERIGDLDDLEVAISSQRLAVDLTPDDHPDRSGRLNNLSIALQARFERLDDLQDLEDAISNQRLAITNTPDGHPDKPIQLSTLSSALQIRFVRLGEIDDIESAVSAQRLAVEHTPEDHPDRPARMSNLGNLLRSRFERLVHRDDIDSAISFHRSAVASTVDDHPAKPGRIYSLGNALNVRFKISSDSNDLEEAIAAQRVAVGRTPDGHPHKPSRLSSLANSLFDRYRWLGELQDLECAISTHQLAVDVAPNNHSDKAFLLNNLGNALRSRLERDITKPNFDRALDCFMTAATRSVCAPFIRLQCLKKCARLVSRYPQFASPESTLCVYSRVMDVLPQIVWLGHSVSRRYDETSKLAEWVSTAVSTAVRLGALPRAIEWLEAGRSFVWSQILTLRMPSDNLREHYPLLAGNLEKISKELQRTGNVSHFPAVSIDDDKDPVRFLDFTAANPDADRHRQLVIQYDNALSEARRCSGFEDFLRPPRLANILPAVEHAEGPVVFVNVHSSFCNALVLHPDGNVVSVLLPDLSEDKARKLRSLWLQNLEWCNTRTRAVLNPDSITQKGSANMFGRVLTRVWSWIVHPILLQLDLIDRESDRMPHITWCPTGPLTQLPLHAAGVYDNSQAPPPRVYDFVVSSYIPSLSALLRCLQMPSARALEPNVLIVAQPATPGLSQLPGTRDECARLRMALSETAYTLLEHEQAIVTHTLSVMRQHPWVHLACHGTQDAKDPTQSAFALYDGRLTLSALMDTTSENAELAFLSACQTAVGDEKVPEESVHLAAGMLAVGFKGVVATMWSIGDADAPVVVEAYYRKLLELRRSGQLLKGYTGAAYALHHAQKVLREHVGDESFVKWAPFVHLGV